LKPLRPRLFWKIGLPFLFLLLLVLAAVYFYTARVLDDYFLEAAFEQLDSLGRLVESRPPPLDDTVALQDWADWMAKTGARATVVRADGKVLADSHENPTRMENHADRPEIVEAFADGRGRSTRYSDTVKRELVYLAIRHQPGIGRSVVLRLAWPLERVNEAIAEVLHPVGAVSLVTLVLGAVFSLLFSRALSLRVQKLKEFSRRVAEGDFRPVAVQDEGDELVELTRALNDTATRLDETIRTLKEERNQSAAILGSMSEGVVVVGPDERIIFCNQAFLNSLAISVAPNEGKTLIEVTRQSELPKLLHDALASGEAVQSELEAATPRPRHFQVTAAPIQTEESSAAVLVLHDITEIRRVERVRRDFVDNVSHEFKTPLTAIQGFAETLLGGALEDPKNSRRFLEIISDHAARLSQLTNELLKLSQIETGRLELNLRPVAVPDLVDACLETAKIKAKPKGLSLDNQCSDDLPRVQGDRQHLREVLQNLLDNAIQYTPSGGKVTISASANGDMVKISVADSGVGILHDEQQRIFERFYRTEVARTLEISGTGLGLAIAKHLIEAHEGRIEVESEVGKGSVFSVYVPINKN
jgi:two-component system phosphate regulon sensor histidine kinase PhoR